MAHPGRLDKVAGSAYAHGNVTSGGGRSIEYASHDLPTAIQRGLARSEFAYGPDRERLVRRDLSGGELLTLTILLVSAAAFADAMLAGADFGQALRSGLIAGITAGAFSGLSGTLPAAQNFGDQLLRGAAFGFVGGVTSVIGGGRFGHGFASAGLAARFGGPLGNWLVGLGASEGVARTVAAALVGGTSSALTGGKFANGAAWAAFSAAGTEIVQAERGPTALELTSARLAKSIQDPDFTGADGYTAIASLDVKGSGMRAVLFENEAGHRILVFDGTEATSLANWKANLGQALGLGSEPYAQGVHLAKALHQWSGGNVHFAGFSLGGGLASAAAVETGGSATVFNAAGLHGSTVGGKALSSASVVHFHSSLDLLQLGNAPTPVRVPGEQVPLGAAGLHGMDGVCRAMGC